MSDYLFGISSDATNSLQDGGMQASFPSARVLSEIQSEIWGNPTGALAATVPRTSIAGPGLVYPADRFPGVVPPGLGSGDHTYPPIIIEPSPLPPGNGAAWGARDPRGYGFGYGGRDPRGYGFGYGGRDPRGYGFGYGGQDAGTSRRSSKGYGTGYGGWSR